MRSRGRAVSASLVVSVAVFAAAGAIAKNKQAKHPLHDTSRWDDAKKIETTTRAHTKKYKFSAKYGKFEFWYDGTGGRATFTPNNKVGDAKVAWIQVVRTGVGDRWLGTEKDIKAFSKNNMNFVHRTEPVYGFRVDRTKFENTPFYDQTCIPVGTKLEDYKIAFAVDHRVGGQGEKIEFSDNPGLVSGLQRMRAADATVDRYRFHFLLSAMDIETGKIFGTIEWGIEAVREVKDGKPLIRTYVLKPRRIKGKDPILKGQYLAWRRWNKIFPKHYGGGHGPFKYADVIFPIPGQGEYWKP